MKIYQTIQNIPQRILNIQAFCRRQGIAPSYYAESFTRSLFQKKDNLKEIIFQSLTDSYLLGTLNKEGEIKGLEETLEKLKVLAEKRMQNSRYIFAFEDGVFLDALASTLEGRVDEERLTVTAHFAFLIGTQTVIDHTYVSENRRRALEWLSTKR